MRTTFVSILLLVVPTLAAAHNVDCNNKTQPLEIKSGCCGQEDYRALKMSEVRRDGVGYDVYLDGKWHPVVHDDTWLIAQPTGAACWGVWYRRGLRDHEREIWVDHNGNTDDYSFYCLEQPAMF